MSDKLSKIIEFAQSTGDKLIVTDKEGNDPVVIMPFEMYQHLLGLGNKVDYNDPNFDQKEEVFLPEDEYFDDLAMETDASEPVRVAKKPEKVQKPPFRQAQAPKRAESEEKSPKLAERSTDEEDPEEEQFYLEPVE